MTIKLNVIDLPKRTMLVENQHCAPVVAMTKSAVSSSIQLGKMDSNQRKSPK